MKDMTKFKCSIVVVLLMLAWIYIYIYIYIGTWKMINPIHITKLKLLYDAELTNELVVTRKLSI